MDLRWSTRFQWELEHVSFGMRVEIAAKDFGEPRIIMAMAVIHISEAEAARDFAGLMARVRAGAEVVIENGKLPWRFFMHQVRRAVPSRSASRCCRKLPRAAD